MTHEPVVQLHNVTKNFRGVTAVNNVSLSVAAGDVYGVLGPNGAGKTTTIAMILGLVAPTSGTIEVLGQSVTINTTNALQQVGSVVGDRPAYIPYVTGRQNVEYMAKLRQADLTRVDHVLHLMGLTAAADRYPDKYSTGMKQRLGLAMALVHRPQLLILDEPTNGMDPVGMREIRELIKYLAEQGITIIICSHLLPEIEQVCNRVAIFNQGQIVAEQALADLSTETLEEFYVRSVVGLA
jgi:ABC-2 type transport system ATP-binding protein